MKLVATMIGTLAVTAVAAAAVLPHSGLYGTVERGPITPICIAGQPCSAPARNTVIRFTTAAGVTVSTRTGADGSYRIRLRPATYEVSATTGRIEPTVAHVRRAQFIHIDFGIDTGIR